MSSTPTLQGPERGTAPLGLIHIQGAQAREFLQGQLTADLATLSAQRALLACCNSAQGRVQAVMWLIERSDGIVALLPDSIAATTAARLRKYVLRSKVVIDSTARLMLATLEPGALPPDVSLSGDGEHRQVGDESYLRLPGHEAVVLLSAGAPAAVTPDAAMRWRLADIRAGMPQVYPATHEAFVAQMLNLDLLGAISFQKGCYTGQEIIARTHFRGAIKRRMLRFRSTTAPPPAGTRILAGAEHAGDVVDAAATEQGCELLAVISLAQRDAPLSVEGCESVTLQKLELPYPV